MSKYTESTTTFRDKDCLLAALKEAGYTATTYHEEAINLTGYMGDTRPEVANIVIPRSVKGGMGGSSNDVGFVRQSDGTYLAIVSEFDNRSFGRKLNEVKQNYTEAVTKKFMASKGHRFVQRIMVNGKRQLEFAVV